MFEMSMKRFFVLLMSFIALFTANSGADKADFAAEHAFPRIAAEKQELGTVRIMSFNIRCADVNGVPVSERLDIGVRQILSVMPDSLGVQEATPEWMKHLDRSLPMYAWVGVERDNGNSPLKGGESCPLFYLKSKYRLVDSGNFWLSETPDQPSLGPGAACKRICTWAKLQDRRTGGVYVHVNTHFDHVSEAARVEGARIVVRFIEEHFAELPVVFTADMNTRENGEAYALMTGSLQNAAQIALDAKTTATFHAANPETHTDATIDFILCSPDIDVRVFRVVSKGVDGRFVSDHFPLYADVILPKNAGRRPVC